jgi:hypothetical protein
MATSFITPSNGLTSDGLADPGWCLGGHFTGPGAVKSFSKAPHGGASFQAQGGKSLNDRSVASGQTFTIVSSPTARFHSATRSKLVL